MEYPIYQSVQNKLDYFIHSKKTPHIIFYGPSGTGKRNIVNNFLLRIYGGDKQHMKTNVMFVNCAHGKGIKFIRNELKFFAKSNIQANSGVVFKSIILLNADFLTIDAQSALRRCIELFSMNTRFFIIIENKDNLLNPILSRFCDIYIPEMIYEDEIVNLHSIKQKHTFDFEKINKTRKEILEEKMRTYDLSNHENLVNIVSELYNCGYSCFDVIEWCKTASFTEKELSEYVIVYSKIKSEYRCEKLLMFYMFDFIFLRKNKELKNIGFM
jgi:DNA polymerase III delta prime subunit